MASLPRDIITDILLVLPAKSICRFRCACKVWYELFKNPKFIKTHLHHAIEIYKFSLLLDSYKDPYYSDKDGYYTIDFDVASSSYHMAVQTDSPFNLFVRDSQLLDYSCDGLIVLSTLNPNGDDTLYMIFLLNPSTGEYKKISIPTSIRNKSYKGFYGYGVCYDWKIDDYKLFLIVAELDDDDDEEDVCSEVFVRRLGSNWWNSIGNIPYNKCHHEAPLRPLNGIIQWIGMTKVIVRFDIVEETIKEIQIPSCCLDDVLYSIDDMEVHVLGEDLYLLVNAAFHKTNSIDLWVMKDYGVIDSWTKVFSLSQDITKFYSVWPLQCLNKNGQILLQGSLCEGTCGDVLLSYDPNSGSLMPLDIPCIPERFHVTPFVGSLVSLNSGKFIQTTR